MAAKESKTLITGLNWVGDMVTAHSFIRALREKDDSQFDLLARGWSAPIGKMMPEITNMIVNGFKPHKLDYPRIKRLAKKLEQTGYAKAYVLSDLFKSALAPWLANIPLRYGWQRI